MRLHLTSCEPVREPGFSKSECLELARRIDRGDMIERWFECDDCGAENMISETLTIAERDTIVAALRAYAK